jgi:hypothetical protein
LIRRQTMSQVSRRSTKAVIRPLGIALKDVAQPRLARHEERLSGESMLANK